MEHLLWNWKFSSYFLIRTKKFQWTHYTWWQFPRNREDNGKKFTHFLFHNWLKIVTVSRSIDWFEKSFGGFRRRQRQIVGGRFSPRSARYFRKLCLTGSMPTVTVLWWYIPAINGDRSLEICRPWSKIDLDSTTGEVVARCRTNHRLPLYLWA